MVYDASLGYDPEEWEECPETEHFVMFSYTTRVVLSILAIAFTYFFFNLVNENKNKGSRSKEDQSPEKNGEKLTIEKAKEVLKGGLENMNQNLQIRREKYQAPSSADELLREANDYLAESANTKSRDASPRRFVDLEITAAQNDHLQTEYASTPKSINQQITAQPHDLLQKAGSYASSAYEAASGLYHKATSLMSDIAEVPEGHISLSSKKKEQFSSNSAYEQSPQPEAFMQVRTKDERETKLPQFVETEQSDIMTTQTIGVQSLSSEHYEPQDGDHVGRLHRRSIPRNSQERRDKKMSQDEENALREWQKEREILEAERLAKLQDREVGGSESEFSTDSRALEHLAPASHISYHSKSPDSHNISDDVPLQEETPILEKRLRNRIEEIAGLTPKAPRGSYRDSDLTDYDISDFHTNEAFADLAAPRAADVKYVTSGTEPVSSRRTTGDSDEYVEPIYDVPPKQMDKAITSEEARQLQELCQEYDFGADVRDVQATFKLPEQQPQPPQHHTQVEQHQKQQQEQPGLSEIQPKVTIEQPQSAPAPIAPPRLNKQQRVEGTPEYNVLIQPLKNEDEKNIAAAEIFVQDALEYLGNQEEQLQPSPASSGFIIEEEMLSSQGASAKKPEFLTTKQPSAVATSQMIRTKDVFERMEHDEHDDMTYAPEIQSVEIPPDQMSENSENLQEYFDRVAAEGTAAQMADALRAQANARNIPVQQLPQAPHIMSISGNRAASSSSLASGRSGRSVSGMSNDGYPKLRKQSSLLSVLGVTSMQEMLLTIDSLDTLSEAMRKAGLESTNLIFGIDYTASNKYQGEESFGGRSLHTIHPNLKNPYQQVITILGRTLAPFASTGCFPAFGFGDAKTGDWGVFPLRERGYCATLDEVLKVYNEITPTVDLSGPTNFAPLIHQAMDICQKTMDYHILVIIADGQVTNERATRRAIVQACQYPLSIIVVGVGDGPWDMMKVFDESLPKRPWDNFHFVEFQEIMRKTAGHADGDVKFAVQSLLEIPDQYRCVCELGLLRNRPPPLRGSEIRKELKS